MPHVLRHFVAQYLREVLRENRGRQAPSANAPDGTLANRRYGVRWRAISQRQPASPSVTVARIRTR